MWLIKKDILCCGVALGLPQPPFLHFGSAAMLPYCSFG